MSAVFDLPGGIAIGFRSPQLRDLDVSAKMALARELGMRVIEPQVNQLELQGPDDARAYRAAADTAGIAVPSVGCELPLLAGDPAALDLRSDLALSIAEILGSGQVFTRVLWPEAPLPQAEGWERLEAALAQLLPRFAAAGIDCAIEADPGTFVTSLERMHRVLALAPGTALRPNLDVCNLYAGGSDASAAMRELAPLARSGHIKDRTYVRSGGSELPIGSGDLDWSGLLGLAVAAGGPRSLFIEHCKSPEAVRAAAEHLRGCLQPA
jgi:sugar phosphate isomerase/epimerase